MSRDTSGPPRCRNTKAALTATNRKVLFIMATDHPITLNIETLNAIGARLSEHAAAITQDIAADLKLAARIADRLASLRSRVAEIAQAALDRPQWDAAVFARDVRGALAAAENGGDLPEANRSSHYS
jgi:hypothetical protein